MEKLSISKAPGFSLLVSESAFCAMIDTNIVPQVDCHHIHLNISLGIYEKTFLLVLSLGYVNSSFRCFSMILGVLNAQRLIQLRILEKYYLKNGI